MKLLLDQNLSRRLIPTLLPAFPDSTQVALINMDKTNDETIWRYAKDNDYTIVSKDSDFQELSILNGFPPKIIFLKLGNKTNQEILDALLSNQDTILKMLTDKTIGCIEILDA